MVLKRDNIFALLVRENEGQRYDLEGRIAYSEYKTKKRKFFETFAARNENKQPSEDEVRQWVHAQIYHIEEMRELASQVLETYAEGRIEAASEDQINMGRLKALDSEAGKAMIRLQSWRGFFYQVLAGVVTSVVLAILVWILVESNTLNIFSS